jgi:putative transposase
MVAEPWHYPWSSARAYALGEADPLLTEDPCYTTLSPVASRRQQLWREFLLGDDLREEAVRKGDWAVGDDSFRGRMAQVLGRPLPRPRGRPPKAGRAQAGPLMTQAPTEQ